MTTTAQEREILAADPAIAPETKEAITGFFDEIDGLRGEVDTLSADRDRLRDELERQAAEIERLRNKRQQSCAKGDGPAVWCADCLRAEVAAQQTRDRELMRRAADALDDDGGWLARATRVAEVVEQMRVELTKGVTP